MRKISLLCLLITSSMCAEPQEPVQFNVHFKFNNQAQQDQSADNQAHKQRSIKDRVAHMSTRERKYYLASLSAEEFKDYVNELNYEELVSYLLSLTPDEQRLQLEKITYALKGYEQFLIVQHHHSIYHRLSTPLELLARLLGTLAGLGALKLVVGG